MRLVPSIPGQSIPSPKDVDASSPTTRGDRGGDHRISYRHRLLLRLRLFLLLRFRGALLQLLVERGDLLLDRHKFVLRRVERRAGMLGVGSRGRHIGYQRFPFGLEPRQPLLGRLRSQANFTQLTFARRERRCAAFELFCLARHFAFDIGERGLFRFRLTGQFGDQLPQATGAPPTPRHTMSPATIASATIATIQTVGESDMI